MRLIDADACREDFMQEVYAELESDPDNVRANRIIDLFDMMPTIESPRDWTPCAEGLPTEDGKYWVTFMYYGRPFVDKRIYHTRSKTWVKTVNVVAWMPANPKPEPYNPDHIVDPNKMVKEPFVRSEACQRCEDNEKCLWELDAICHCCKPKKADHNKRRRRRERMDSWLDLEPRTFYQVVWKDNSWAVGCSPTMYNIESAQPVAEAFRRDGCEAHVIEITQTRKICTN